MSTYTNARRTCSRAGGSVVTGILLAIVLLLSTFGCAHRSDAPIVMDDADRFLADIGEPDILYVPTPQEVVDVMLELAKVSGDDIVYDLGCGDGRIVVTAAKRYGSHGVGYDIDPERVRDSIQNVRANDVEDLVRIEQRDIFTLDLSEADVVTLYLLSSLNVRLIPQLRSLKPGSRIVSHDFGMQGVVIPDSTVVVDVPGDREHTVYLWITPLETE